MSEICKTLGHLVEKGEICGWKFKNIMEMKFPNFSQLLAMAALLLCAACGNAPEKCADAHSYKSIIRLWPVHHTDSTTLNQMVEAFRKYPGACDEVWFCVPFGSFDLEHHRQQARMMARAADKMRTVGVQPSIQSIVLGHPEPAGDTSPIVIEWPPIMSIGGVSARNQSCPRQPKYLQRIAEIQAIYAEAVQPPAYMLDDDLRITAHAPADAICFCDTCMAQFNAQHGYNFTRETLGHALVSNEGGGEIRRRWIAFSHESLAGVARAFARDVHKVSPRTQMGLQHANYHSNLMECHDWNKIFTAMEEETGIVPASRPGHGFYNDAAPRGMMEKGYAIARQISRLNPNITDISPEVEGYLHKATGKSAQGICTETLFYLALGGTQMSYAIVCSAQEPVEWYAETYFKFLNRYKKNFCEYVAFNEGTQPGGLDSYISPNHVLRNVQPGEGPWNWTTTASGSYIAELATIGFPFAPGGDYTCATYVDGAGVMGIPLEELKQMLRERNFFIDSHAWHVIQNRGTGEKFTAVPLPEELKSASTDTDDGLLSLGATSSGIVPQCFETSTGTRIAVVPSFTTDLNNADRQHLLRIADWASKGQMPVMMDLPALGTVVPRVTPDGTLRSVAYLNCTISEQDNVTLRLRHSPRAAQTKATWKMADHKDIPLKTEWKNNELHITLPPVPGWHIGWIALE